MKKRAQRKRKGFAPRGFTLVELLLGSSILLVVIIGTLALFERSNKISVDQTRFSEVQHNVRSAMYFVSRDARMAGVGLIPDITGYAVEGQDAFSPAPEAADSLKLMGNFSDPLGLRIEKYQGGEGGASAQADLYDYELENAPYDCAFYDNKFVLVMSTKCPGCVAFRFIDEGKLQGCDGSGKAHIIFPHGQAPEVNPPGGLIDENCAVACWEDAIITMAEIKYYWLDTTGDADDYLTINPQTADGYLGIPNVLYMSTNTGAGSAQHMPLAMNIENIQFQYNGDFSTPSDGVLDGFTDWDPTWTILSTDDAAARQTKRERLAKLSQIRIQILGRTDQPYLTVSKSPVTDVQLYRRPALSNSRTPATDDWRRRFLLESTATIRNNALVIYNTGQH
ncbi:MAG: PilW family protein [Candidatus Aminicenantes bacterium]|nr:PilW family protein [Candidatus Aminicenantes bacterium]